MRTIRTKLYKFSELNEQAKDEAITSLYDINVTDAWWDFLFEDAKNIGLELTGFDLGRSNDCTGKFIEDALHAANLIVKNHGEDCETYKTATAFIKDRDAIVDSAHKDEDGDFENEYELDGELDDCEAEFLKSLLEDWLIILRNEYEYLTGKKAIIETIEANEYEFTQDGKRL